MKATKILKDGLPDGVEGDTRDPAILAGLTELVSVTCGIIRHVSRPVTHCLSSLGTSSDKVRVLRLINLVILPEIHP